MSSFIYIITREGIYFADDGAQLIVQRMEQAIVSGEASCYVVNFTNQTAVPIVSTYDLSGDVTDIARDWALGQTNALVRDTTAALLGTLAGIGAIPFGPSAALA